MPTDRHRIHAYLAELAARGEIEALRQRLQPHSENQPARIPGGGRTSPEAVESRWEVLNAPDEAKQALADPQTLASMDAYQRNIENFIGTVKVPVGLAGPLRVNGLFARGDFYVPLATTEAALVASYSRGAQLMTEAGGCTAILLNEGVGRAPAFAFERLEQACLFAAWAAEQMDAFRQQVATATHHGRLLELRVVVEGNHVFVYLEFSTGDASGQNMVTLATQAVCNYIEEASPVRPAYHFVEGNYSGDKKASALSFQNVRGKKVSAEIRLPEALVRERLHATPQRLTDYWRIAAMGGTMSGTMGVQGHFANGLAALYLACGQDVACVAESAVGITRLETREDGSLYAAVTLPSLMVGTVGGGTGLPSQSACLKLLKLSGENPARALAEICAALCLAGELSIIGALSSGEFARAHQRRARGRTRKSNPAE